MPKIHRHQVVYFLTALTIVALASPAAASVNQSVDELAAKLTATLEGEVVKVSGSTLYISLGRQDGVVEGMQFEIAREGEPIKLNGKVLGAEQEVIGTLEASRVQKQLTQGKVIGKAKQTPALGDKIYQKRKHLKRLVIVPFSFNQEITEFSKNFQEKLITTLVQKGLQVVERSQLEQVLKEQKLTYSGLFNLSSAKQVGKLLGAEGIILGTLADQGNSISINARIVDLGSANTVAAAEVELAKTPTIAEGLSQMVAGGSRGTSTSRKSSVRSKKEKSIKTVNLEKTTFELLGCTRKTNVDCEFIITNHGVDRLLSIAARHRKVNSVLHDNLGNSYKGKTAQISNSAIFGSTGGHTLISELPNRAMISFEGVSPNASSIARLKLGFHYKKWFFVKFRDVPIK